MLFSFVGSNPSCKFIKSTQNMYLLFKLLYHFEDQITGLTDELVNPWPYLFVLRLSWFSHIQLMENMFVKGYVS